MQDKALGIFLVMLYGIGGIVILVVVWVQPMPLVDRMLATFVGSVGLVWASIQALFLMPVRTKTNVGTDLPEVEVKKGHFNRC